MAWSFDGITKAQFESAVATHEAPRVLSATPWLVKMIQVNPDSTTAVEILHGESIMPDIMFVSGAIDDPDAAQTISLYAGSTAAYLAIDCGGASATAVNVCLIWLNAASGGIS